jgi:hypothetical protein
MLEGELAGALGAFPSLILALLLERDVLNTGNSAAQKRGRVERAVCMAAAEGSPTSGTRELLRKASKHIGTARTSSLRC